MANWLQNFQQNVSGAYNSLQERRAEDEAARIDEIKQNYQELFGREPEQAGIDYWLESGFTGDKLTTALKNGALDEDKTAVNSANAESRAEVSNLYQQLFGREGKEDGINYWVDSGLTGNELIASMLKGAQGDDIPGNADEGFDLDGYTKAMQDWVGGTGVFADNGENTATGGLLTDGPGEFTESPGYQFRLEEGQKAIERGAAARGDLLGGATQKALNRFGQDYATNDYDNFLSRYYDSLNPWLSLANAGQVSSSNSSTAANNLGSSVASSLSNTGTNIGTTTMNSNSLLNQNSLATGDAIASGEINAANALSQIGPNAINAYATWKYFA